MCMVFIDNLTIYPQIVMMQAKIMIYPHKTAIIIIMKTPPMF